MGFMSTKSRLEQELKTLESAARWVAEVIQAVPDEAWDRPGLGKWSIRSLVGHTSRALLTIEQYLGTAAEVADIDSTEAYYERVAGLAAADPATVLQRGVDAGKALGASPAIEYQVIADRVIARLVGSEDRPVITLAGSILLSDYLSTRTFELAVHGLDIARVVGSEALPPSRVLEQSLFLCVRLAQRSGRGAEVLFALTGRASLPTRFTVLP